MKRDAIASLFFFMILRFSILLCLYCSLIDIKKRRDSVSFLCCSSHLDPYQPELSYITLQLDFQFNFPFSLPIFHIVLPNNVKVKGN